MDVLRHSGTDITVGAVDVRISDASGGTGELKVAHDMWMKDARALLLATFERVFGK